MHTCLPTVPGPPLDATGGAKVQLPSSSSHCPPVQSACEVLIRRACSVVAGQGGEPLQEGAPRPHLRNFAGPPVEVATPCIVSTGRRAACRVTCRSTRKGLARQGNSGRQHAHTRAAWADEGRLIGLGALQGLGCCSPI